MKRWIVMACVALVAACGGEEEPEGPQASSSSSSSGDWGEEPGTGSSGAQPSSSSSSSGDWGEEPGTGSSGAQPSSSSGGVEPGETVEACRDRVCAREGWECGTPTTTAEKCGGAPVDCGGCESYGVTFTCGDNGVPGRCGDTCFSRPLTCEGWNWTAGTIPETVPTQYGFSAACDPNKVRPGMTCVSIHGGTFLCCEETP